MIEIKKQNTRLDDPLPPPSCRQLAAPSENIARAAFALLVVTCTIIPPALRRKRIIHCRHRLTPFPPLTPVPLKIKNKNEKKNYPSPPSHTSVSISLHSSTPVPTAIFPSRQFMLQRTWAFSSRTWTDASGTKSIYILFLSDPMCWRRSNSP